ncbi:MAG TPA: DUF2182 domain-containing protein, partial [Candidatus Acidoferrales bacterium]|nr:DUF2182 domain-containing protein [Candidatus Acidoferrales bacterium]
LCCSGLMLVLLTCGVMDLGTMTLVAAAITAERIAPQGNRVARATGVVLLTAGAAVILRSTTPS